MLSFCAVLFFVLCLRKFAFFVDAVVVSVVVRTNVIQFNVCLLFSGRGRSHGPHKFYIPVVPRRHSFDERIFAAPVSESV